MTTILSKQVSVYHDDLVMRASRAAINCWEMHKPVQELILASPGMVASIQAVATNPKISDDLSDRQELLSTCERMLDFLNSLMREAEKVREHNFDLSGLPELQDAMTELRFLMADILDANAAASGRAIPPTAEASVKDFETACKEMPPPQSWYEEDFRGLRGPIAK